MKYRSFYRTILVSYLVGSLCAPRAMAVQTSAPVIVPGTTSQQPGYDNSPPPMQDGSTAFAQDVTGGGSSSDRGNRPGGLSLIGTSGEYVSGNYPGAVLIPVTILGPVSKQGIHHIPTRTHLLKFLSLAGGINTNAAFDDITIKRITSRDKGVAVVKGEEVYKEEVLHFDAEEFLHNPGSRGPILQQDDIVIVKENKPFFSNNTLITIGLISSILGIVVSGMVIANGVK